MQRPVFRGGPWDGAVYGEAVITGHDAPPKRLKMFPLAVLDMESCEVGASIDLPEQGGLPLFIEPIYELSEDGTEYRHVGNESQTLKRVS